MLICGADRHTVYLYDIYGNLVLSFEVEETIIALRGSPTQKDPFIAVSTEEGFLLVYELDFGRRDTYKPSTKKKMESQNITATPAIVLSDEIYSKNYKKYFSNYKYTLKPIMIRSETTPDEDGQKQDAKFTQHEYRRIELTTPAS